jgi:hypothetical protein
VETKADGHPKAGGILVLVMLTAAIAVALYFGFGMPGMDHSTQERPAQHDQMTDR